MSHASTHLQNVLDDLLRFLVYHRVQERDVVVAYQHVAQSVQPLLDLYSLIE